MERHRIAVVGGNNMDISATSRTPLVFGDSNPGFVRTGLGGVGRNIAENLARLGQSVSMITAFGDDAFAERALRQAREVGMDVSDALMVKGEGSCVYICVNNADGDMAVAVNDMALCDRITPEYLSAKMLSVNRAEAVVFDTNLREDTITYLANHTDATLFADAVSTKKAPRLTDALSRLYGLKANRLEIELLTGLSLTTDADLSAAAQMLHQKGVRYVLITLGGRGAFASNGIEYALHSPFPGDIVNTTGCGDAFTAAAITAILDGLSVGDVLRRGLAAAAVTARCEQAVSERLTPASLAVVLDS